MGKVKVGFIGAGGIASVHLKNISKNEQAEIVAICDVDKDIAIRVSREYGVPYYTNVDHLLAEIKLDALIISVPPFAHGNIEEKAAQLGIHLLIEKPIGLDMETVNKKYEVIKNSGIICATGYCLRYLDTVAKAKTYLLDKEIAMVRGYYLTSFVKTSWYRVMEKSGGQLVEQATHILDLIRYLCGEIDKVYANMSLQLMKDIEKINIPDVTSVNFTHKNGAVGHLDCSFIQHDHRMGLEILGKGYRIELDGVNLTIVDNESTITYKSNVDFYEEQDKAFIQAILIGNKDLILSNYENALRTLEVTLSANLSNQVGKPINIR